MASETTTLRIKAEQLGSISEIKELLTDFENAYNSIYAFEFIVQSLPADIERSLSNLAERERFLSKLFRDYPRKEFAYDYERLYHMMEYFYFDGRRLLPPLKAYYEGLDINAVVLPAERLTLNKINIQSPGFWEFMGTLNPLTQIREYLKDRHERKKDNDYRSAQEKRKGELDIIEKEDNIINNRIEMLKKAGYSELEIRQMVNALVLKPLTLLDRHQDNGRIEGPEDNNGQSA